MAHATVDMAAVFKALHQMEEKISYLQDSNRFDKIPPWAAAMLTRLDSVEKENIDLRRNLSRVSLDTPPGGENPPRQHTIEDLKMEDMILTKFRSEFEGQISATKVSHDSQITSLQMEIDRVHKLMQIRPTTSDLHLVSLSVTDINKKMHIFLEDVSKTVQNAVLERVAVEMATLSEKIMDTAAIHEGSMGVVGDKFDRAHSDMTVLRELVTTNLDAMQDELTGFRGDLSKFQTTIIDFDAKMDATNAKNEQAFEEIRYMEDKAAEDFLNHKTSLAKKLSIIEDTLVAQGDRAEEIAGDLEAKHAAVLESIEAINENAKEFKDQYECDIETLGDKDRQISEALDSLTQKYLETDAYVQSMKQIDSLQKILDQEQKIKENLALLSKSMEELKVFEKKFEDLLKFSQNTDKDVKKLKGDVVTQDTYLKALTDDQKKAEKKILSAEASILSIKETVSEVLKMREDIINVIQLSQSARDEVTKCRGSVQTALELVDDHERRIDQLTVGLDEAVEESKQEIESTKALLNQLVMDNQFESDRKIRELTDLLNSQVEMLMDSQAAMKKILPKEGQFFGGNTEKEGYGQISGLPGLAMNDVEQSELASANAKFLADLCIHFEEHSVKKTYVPEMPQSVSEHVTATSQALVAFIATCTDAEVVQTMLRGSSPDDDFEANRIVELRRKRIEDFILITIEKVVEIHPTPGVIRYEAREKFVKLVRRAMQICMTRHDQVVLVGSSRLGGVKIPTCLACDRPLLDKSRQLDAVVHPEDRPPPLGGGITLSSPSPSKARQPLSSLRVSTIRGDASVGQHGASSPLGGGRNSPLMLGATLSPLASTPAKLSSSASTFTSYSTRISGDRSR